MIIRKAEKKDVKGIISPLIMALDEMKTIFSGCEKEEEIIAKYEEFFLLDEGRYSYKNFYVGEGDEEIAGIIVVYYSDDVEKLDNVMLRELNKNGVIRKEFEKEFYENEYYIDSLAVNSAYQGRGIARKLMEFAEKKGKEQGYEKMSLLVHIDKEKAFSIYKKMGYEEDSKIVLYGETYRHMVKQIK